MMGTLGYSRACLDALARREGGLMHAVLHPDDIPPYRAHAARLRLLADDAVAEFAYRLRHADGTWRWLHSRDMVFRRDADGRVRQIIGAALDIDARRRAEAELSESEERFRAMADGLPLIVWVHDADGHQEFVNRTFCEFFGVTGEEMRGGRWRALMHPEDESDYAAAFLAAVRARLPFHAEVHVRRAELDRLQGMLASLVRKARGRT